VVGLQRQNDWCCSFTTAYEIMLLLTVFLVIDIRDIENSSRTRPGMFIAPMSSDTE